LIKKKNNNKGGCARRTILIQLFVVVVVLIEKLASIIQINYDSGEKAQIKSVILINQKTPVLKKAI
jgi:hypothetical protein